MAALAERLLGSYIRALWVKLYSIFKWSEEILNWGVSDGVVNWERKWMLCSVENGREDM